MKIVLRRFGGGGADRQPGELPEQVRMGADTNKGNCFRCEGIYQKPVGLKMTFPAVPVNPGKLMVFKLLR